MLRKIKSIINGSWIQDVIDNFDPYGVKERLDIDYYRDRHEQQHEQLNKEK